MRKWLVVGAIALLLSASCGSDADSGDDSSASASGDAATEVEPTPTEEVAEDSAEESAADPAMESDDADTAPSADGALFDSDAELFDGEFRPIDPGSYLVDTLGTPFSVTFDGDWWVQPNSDGHAVFTHPDSMGPGDRDVVFLRPTALAEPGAPYLPLDELEPWPVDDIAGWLDELDEGYLSAGPEQTTVGGWPATRFAVEMTESSQCSDGGWCIAFADNSELSGILFEIEHQHVVYWVDQGDEPPIAISIGIPPGEDAFIEEAEALVATVAFGEPAGHPVDFGDVDPWELGYDSDVPAGRAVFPALGGISFELDAERFVVQPEDDFLVVLFDESIEGDLELVLASGLSDGTTFDGIDDAIAGLEAMEAAPERLGTVETTLGTATIVGVERPGGPPRPGSLMFTTPSGRDEGTWFAPDFGRLWLWETERGIVMATAESFGTTADLDAVLAVAEVIWPTLQFETVDAAPAGEIERNADGDVLLASVFANGEPSGDGILLAPGRYASGSLGVDLVLDLPVEANLMDDLPGLIGLGRPGATFADNQLTAVFVASGVPNADGTSAPMPTDLAGYIEGNERWTVLDSGTSVIGGVDAPWWDLQLLAEVEGAMPCWAGNCFPLFTHDTVGAVSVSDEWRFRLWSIGDPELSVFGLLQARTGEFDEILAHSSQIIRGVEVG